MTTREAAEVLGISIEAVRKRIERGQLDHEREDNRVYIYLDDDRTESGRDVEGEEASAVVETLREQVAYLRGLVATRDQELALRAEEIRRRDSALEREQQLTAFFAERLREIEAPAHDDAAGETREDASESPESHGPSPTPPAESGGPETGAQDRPRWLYIVALAVLLALLALVLGATVFISQPGGFFGA